MITDILSDFSRVILFPVDGGYNGGLNALYKEKVISQKEQFEDHFRFNEELLDKFSVMRGTFRFSLYTTDIIQNDPEAKKRLQPIFENVFAANDLGLSKKDPDGYRLIAERLGRKPDQILYLDDNESNVQAARAAGFKTLQFFSNENLFKKLEDYQS